MTSLTITIDRSSLGLPPLVLLGHGNEPGLAVSDYTEPAMQARVTYAPDSAYVHGSVATSAVWQQALMSFVVFPDQSVNETQARAWMAELAVALMRLAYQVRVEVNGAPAETWRCDAGALVPAGARTRPDLEDSNPQWAVTIPCYPIRQIA